MALLPAPPDHAQEKTGHAAEQDRPDVLRQRQAWFENQLDLDPERLVFVDETFTSTKMARTHGRCQKGQRLRMGLPHGHWKTTTLVVALSVIPSARSLDLRQGFVREASPTGRRPVRP